MTDSFTPITLDDETGRNPSKARRYFLLALLYFSEGAPIGYLWWAMPTKLRAAGMPVDQVAWLVAALAVPWTFKFLWAPAVDVLQGPRWGLRGWIGTMQVLMGLTLLPLVFIPLGDALTLVIPLLLMHAVCAATQDVAIDALAIRILAPDERGQATGWMQAGMLLARSLFGGAVLYLEQFVGERFMLIALVLCIWTIPLVLWSLLTPDEGRSPETSQRLRNFGRHLRDIALRRSTWIGLAIAATAGAGFEAVGVLMGPFLVDAKVSTGAIGLFLAIPVVASMVIGALVGGFLSDRFGQRRLVVLSVLAIAMWVGFIAIARSTGMAGVPLLIVIGPLYLLIGLLTASSYALLMNLCDPALGGTQFSTFMGATNFCEVWAVALGGTLAASRGYPYAFALLAGVSLVAIPLTLLLPKRGEKAVASDNAA